MHQIWKFEVQNSAEIEIPKNAEILSAHNQKDTICLWAKVNPEAEKEIRKIRVIGTGMPISEDHNLVFIGTVLSGDHNYVLHVFEEVATRN